MSGNTAKRLIVIALMLGLAVWAIAANDVVLGLDLRGGVTMRYELQPPDSVPTGETLDSLIGSTVETLNRRIDAYGISERSITRQGDREIVIELPGAGPEEAETIKNVISRVGRLEWRIVASDDLRTGLTLEEQRQKLQALLDANKGKAPDEIDVTPLDLQFGDVRCRWVPYSDKILAERRNVASLDELPRPTPDTPPLASAPLQLSDYELLRIESSRSRNFTGADIEAAYEGRDGRNYPAVGVKISAARSSEFGDFTEEHQGQHLAIVLDGRLAQSPAVINDRLDSEFVIQSGAPAGFPPAEIKDYLTVIRSGSLQMKPQLLFENSLGPSLGESSIKAGTQAAWMAVLVTVMFMIGYYRWHGVHAAIGLACNMLVLTGLLMFLGATITLPGLAGLVLTLGMAVDANILIYERMREEGDRAKSPAQVVKLGFEKAFSTIVDSNVTTFITAVILYKLGSGPIRGFAVVLMLGLITSVWAALFVGRTLYDLLIESGRMQAVGKMSRWIKPGTRIGFMRLGKTCMTISAIAVLASWIGFAVSGRSVYGMDFLGGYKAHVRLAQATPQGEVKSRIDALLPGAQVISVAGEGGTAPGQSHQFIIKVKADPESTGAPADEGRYEAAVKQALGPLLLPEFVTDLAISSDAAAATTTVSGVLHFAGPVEPAVVGARLGFLAGLEISAAAPDAVRVRGTLPGVDLPTEAVTQRLKSAVSGAPGLPPPSEPLIESTSVGSRVGTELRDAAARALILSWLAIIIYLRVRFREYRYGLAAVVALIHDVSVTLGVVCLAHWLGWVDVEIDLTMIAVFLTIIGYSVNDTIVMFDRIRENLPRMKAPLGEVIDVSCNQVLARSILTSLTVFLTLLVIFVLNIGQKNVLEGFAFAMLVGTVVGSYSTIYVASPLLVLFSRRKEGEAT
jgi:SecD/SecF fusion protein